MSNNYLGKAFCILLYALIILMIPLSLDYLFELTVRKNRKEKIMALAKKRSKKTGKPIIAFDNRNHGMVIDRTADSIEEFDGDFLDIVNNIKDDSCVLVISEILEYISDPELKEIVKKMNSISGGDLYCINIEKDSPQTFFNHRISNVMEKPFNLPKEKLKWHSPNDLQKKSQNIYSYVFKVIPYEFFVKKFDSKGKV